jgi:hypothetical protein
MECALPAYLDAGGTAEKATALTSVSSLLMKQKHFSSD